MVNTIQVFVFNACVVAVNCFVMISGYFRIRQSWKGITSLWTQLLFYAVISLILCLWLKPEQSMMVGIKRIVFPLSESGLWFIATYIGLYLMSPLLNAALDHQSRQQKVWTLVLLLIVDVYLGYMHQTEEITINGYPLTHFIVLYWLGNCMNEFKKKTEMVNGGRLFLIIVIVNTVLHAIKMVFPPIAIIYSMRYNAPTTLVATMCLFSWVLTWKIQSKTINWFAKSALAVYVCSEFLPIYYRPILWIHDMYQGGAEAVLLLLFILMFYISVASFDKVRIRIAEPIVKILSVKFERWWKEYKEVYQELSIITEIV